jgi:hypothetical protein
LQHENATSETAGTSVGEAGNSENAGEKVAISESPTAKETLSNSKGGQVGHNSEEIERESKKSKTQRGRTTGGILFSTRRTRSSVAENSRKTRSSVAENSRKTRSAHGASDGTVTRGTKRKAAGIQENLEYAISSFSCSSSRKTELRVV